MHVDYITCTDIISLLSIKVKPMLTDDHSGMSLALIYRPSELTCLATVFRGNYCKKILSSFNLFTTKGRSNKWLSHREIKENHAHNTRIQRCVCCDSEIYAIQD